MISVDGPPTKTDEQQANTILESGFRLRVCRYYKRKTDAKLELENACQQNGDPVSTFTVSAISGIASPSASGQDTSPLSLPPATAQTSQSIFFSSSGAAAPSAGSTGVSNSVTAPVSHATVTQLSTPVNGPSSSPGSTTGVPNVSSNAAVLLSFPGFYLLVLAGIVGGAVLVGL